LQYARWQFQLEELAEGDNLVIYGGAEKERLLPMNVLEPSIIKD
jgi:hypothetical protein